MVFLCGNMWRGVGYGESVVAVLLRRWVGEGESEKMMMRRNEDRDGTEN